MAGEHSEALRDQVLEAAAAKRALAVVGGDTKRFYGRRVDGEPR